ncbi:hypothetical protein AYI68_g2970 [Smittium mucronatum]|uniref:Myb-like domain-containing protein n=1 Tax=Smittium mucronatum TaxID=133383 RepID=A0A1R0H1A1_9FUNG|nr:hypothetical protein AYI68_g2970 [Smittium mucronatum]
MTEIEANENKSTSEFFPFDVDFVSGPSKIKEEKNDIVLKRLEHNFNNSRSILEILLEKKKSLKNSETSVQNDGWEDGGYVQLDEKTSSIFAEFEKREFSVKSRKIKNVFENLNDEEISTTLKMTKNNEDEAIIKLSQPGFIAGIRKEIAKQYESIVTHNEMNEIQLEKYEELLKKRTNIQKKSIAGDVKRKYHTVGRLPLDKALEQLRKHTKSDETGDGQRKDVNLAEAMKGWSSARINAFKAIKTKPNTYYYRFNAPGEVQRVGQWDETEKKLFHARLKEIGANGQWGIFSMTIPGRVGYQCSNYYRFLIENHKLVDPNYVLDSKGKAHYLFSTKKINPDGSVVKEFRTHNKVPRSTKRKRKNYSSSESSMSDYNSEKSNSGSRTSGVNSRYKGAGTKSSGNRRKNLSESDDEIRANEVSLTDDSDYLLGSNSGSDKENQKTKSRRSAPSRRSKAYNSDSGHSSSTSDKLFNGNVSRHSRNENTEFQNQADDGYDSSYNPNNPLPDFIDPITLEKVTKPAISPYGHVMDYDSWIRCLMFPPDGSQKNICPLTKNPLTKRELVILTHDNINDYRFKIVNI